MESNGRKFKNISKCCGKKDYIVRDYVIPYTFTFPLHLHGIKLGLLLDQARQAYRKEKLSKIQIHTLELY